MPDPREPLRPVNASTGSGNIFTPVPPERPIIPPRGGAGVPVSHRGTFGTRYPPRDPRGPDPNPQPVATRERITPYLVLKLHAKDDGTRGQLDALETGMPTLVVSAPGQPSVPFEIKVGTTYHFSAVVSNLGKAPALIGFASLYIIDGNVLEKNWGKPFGPPFCVQDFTAWPRKDAAIRFKSKWTAPKLSGGISDRVSIFLHVQDISGDTVPFVVASGYEDRHIVRRDFHLS